MPLAFAIACSSMWASEVQYGGEQVILTTMDGVKVNGLRIGTGKDTILIYCHSLLSSKNGFDLTGFGSVFLREFDIFTFDFRGHNQSGGFSTCGGV